MTTGTAPSHPSPRTCSGVQRSQRESAAARWMPGRARHDDWVARFSFAACLSLPAPAPRARRDLGARLPAVERAAPHPGRVRGLAASDPRSPHAPPRARYRLAVRRRAFRVANAWIQQPFEFQDAMPHWLGYVAVLLVSLYLAIYPMLAAGLAWRLASPAAKGDPAPAADAAFVLVAGAGWIGHRISARSRCSPAIRGIRCRWCWCRRDLAQPAWLIGTYALSGLVVIAAGAVMLLVRGDWKLAAIGVVAFAALALASTDRCRIATCVPQPDRAPDAARRPAQPCPRKSARPTTMPKTISRRSPSSRAAPIPPRRRA